MITHLVPSPGWLQIQSISFQFAISNRDIASPDLSCHLGWEMSGMFLLLYISFKTHVSLFRLLEQVISFYLYILFGFFLSGLMNQICYMVDLSLNSTSTRYHASWDILVEERSLEKGFGRRDNTATSRWRFWVTWGNQATDGQTWVLWR